jgi:hypothetical protein
MEIVDPAFAVEYGNNGGGDFVVEEINLKMTRIITEINFCVNLRNL